MKKREALEIMLMMWDYIALNGCSKKGAIKALELPEMHLDCSCCEYTQVGMIVRCKKCPTKWPKLDGFRFKSYKCHHSYYQAWCDDTFSETYSRGTKTARSIANLALDALNKEWPEGL